MLKVLEQSMDMKLSKSLRNALHILIFTKEKKYIKIKPPQRRKLSWNIKPKEK